MTAAIEIRNLSVIFHTRRSSSVVALDRISLTVEPGQVFGFLGPNGSGKTTTMHVLLGFVEPSSGEARLFGVDVRTSIARQRIGYLPEHPDTYRFLTGRELLWMTGRLFLMNRSQIRRRVEEVLDLTGLREVADRRTATYSRGMLQRIGLAQAILHDPDLVILDEPTSGLDPLGRAAIRQLVAELRRRGKTVFFSSHELSEVELVCDHLAILCRGRIVAQGATRELVPAGERLEPYFMQLITGTPQGGERG